MGYVFSGEVAQCCLVQRGRGVTRKTITCIFGHSPATPRGFPKRNTSFWIWNETASLFFVDENSEVFVLSEQRSEHLSNLVFIDTGPEDLSSLLENWPCHCPRIIKLPILGRSKNAEVWEFRGFPLNNALFGLVSIIILAVSDVKVVQCQSFLFGTVDLPSQFFFLCSLAVSSLELEQKRQHLDRIGNPQP